MSTSSLSAFLVEDEPHCRADFREILRHFPEVKLLGEADTLGGARKFLGRQAVDLLFLDLSVGRENGLDLVESLPLGPLVVALTAHPQHAVRGFFLNLVDYILKPVEEDRLRSALEKVRHRMAAAPLNPGRVTFLGEIDGKKTVLELSEIIMAESQGNYVILHTPRGRAIKRATFQQVRKKLPATLFLEIARGAVVARSAVQTWTRDSSGRLVLELASGISLRTARSRSAAVLKFLNSE